MISRPPESTQLRVTRVIFSFIVISQLWRPIELKFSQVCYFMHMRSEKTGLRQLPKVSTVFKCNFTWFLLTMSAIQALKIMILLSLRKKFKGKRRVRTWDGTFTQHFWPAQNVISQDKATLCTVLHCPDQTCSTKWWCPMSWRDLCCYRPPIQREIPIWFVLCIYQLSLKALVWWLGLFERHRLINLDIKNKVFVSDSTNCDWMSWRQIVNL